MAVATARRFEVVVYRNKNGTVDKAQVPANATVDLFKQGATVRSNVNGLAVVPVWHPGTIAPGDILWKNGVSSSAMTVAPNGVDVSDPDNVRVTMTSAVTLSAGDRLVRSTNRPNAYSDPHMVGESSSLGTSFQTTESGGGRFSCYVREYRFDFTTTVGSDVRVYPDREGGIVMR